MDAVILGVGYLLAVPPLVKILPGLKEYPTRFPRNKVLLVAELAGTALITASYFLIGSVIGTAINGTWLVIFCFLWVKAHTT